MTIDTLTAEIPADEAWIILRAQPNPIHALVKHLASCPDPRAEQERLMSALSPEEERALLPAIRDENVRRIVWQGAQGKGDDDAA